MGGLQYTTTAVGSGDPSTHCRTASSGHASSGQWNSWNSCGTLPHYLGVVQWAVEPLLYTAAQPHRFGAVGSGTPEVHCHTTAILHGGSGQWKPCNTLLHCVGAVGSGTPFVLCPTACGHWLVGIGHWNSYGTLLHYLGALGSGTLVAHCTTYTTCGHWGVVLLWHTALPTLPVGIGEWYSCGTLHYLHYLWALGSGTLVVHRRTTWGKWAVELLWYAAALPGGNGQWKSCSALPHYLGAVGSGTPAVYCCTT